MNGRDRLSRLLEHVSIQVEPFSLCLLERAWRLILPPAPAPMLHFVIEGKGWLGWADRIRQPIYPGCIAIVPPDLSHSLESGTECTHERVIESAPKNPPAHPIVAGREEAADMVVGCGIVHAELAASMELFEKLPAPLVSDLSSIPGVDRQFDALRNERSVTRTDSPVLRGAIMTQLLVYALRGMRQDPLTAIAWLGAMADPRLMSALHVLLGDPGAPHSVESLARQACMSRSAFAERFQNAFDVSPMKLLKRIRLRHAADLLAGSGLSVERVARHVGFSSQSYFSRAFKAHFGKTPLEYRGE